MIEHNYHYHYSKQKEAEEKGEEEEERQKKNAVMPSWFCFIRSRLAVKSVDGVA